MGTPPSGDGRATCIFDAAENGDAVYQKHRLFGFTQHRDVQQAVNTVLPLPDDSPSGNERCELTRGTTLDLFFPLAGILPAKCGQYPL